MPDLPSISFHFGEKTGWAAGLPGLISSGTVDWTEVRKARGLDLRAFAAWLGEVRFNQPLFSVVGVVDTHIEGKLPLVRTIEEWASSVSAEIRVITPAMAKRVASGPYATRRDVWNWAKSKYDGVTSYEQSAALAALQIVHQEAGGPKTTPSRL